MTLQELTGQESGILIYPDGETLIMNWSEYDEYCLPFNGKGGQVFLLPSAKV